MNPASRKDFKKIVLVTGAGSGLGRAIAEAYLKNDFTVVATDINMDLFNDLKPNKGIIPVKLDVTSPEDVKHCALFIKDNYGKLDVLISNAGIFDFYPLSESGSEKLKKIFDVNVFGLTNLTKHFLSLLIKSKGRLIVISSESHKVPAPFQPYSVSKQVLEKVFNAVRLELMTKGVKSILIRPGAIQTQIMENTIKFKNPISKSVFQNEFENFLRSIPKYISKISTAEEVAQIVFIAGLKKNPKRAYHINNNPIVKILSTLPRKLQEKIVVMSLNKK